MSNPTENPIPSQQDDIKSVLQDTLIQQVQTLLNFTRTDGFALQIPETDTLILAGPLTRIAEFIQREIATPAASFASQSQAAQPTEAVEQIMTLAHSWAMAAYKKALNLPFEDIDAIRKQLRDAAAHIAGTLQATKVQAEPEGWREFLEDMRKSGKDMNGSYWIPRAAMLLDAAPVAKEASQPEHSKFGSPAMQEMIVARAVAKEAETGVQANVLPPEGDK